MFDIILVHARSLLYGVVTACIVHFIVILLDTFRIRKSEHARFVLGVSIVGMGWLLFQYVLWFVVHALGLLSPENAPQHVTLAGCLGFIEMVTPLLFQMALYSVSKLKVFNVRRALVLILPYLVLFILFLATGNRLWTKVGYGYTVFGAIVVPIAIHIQVYRYQKLLKDTYANTTVRDVKWVLTVLYVMVGVFAMWVLLSFMTPSALADCIYMCLSMMAWGFYAQRLSVQNFDIDVMREIAENGELDEEHEPEADKPHAIGEEMPLQSTEAVIAPRVKLKAWQEPHFDEAVRHFCSQEKNFSDPDLSVQDVAQGVGTNRTYVSRWCKEQGCDFSTFITSIRLDYAERQLMETSLTITEILEMSGFSNARHFRTVFVARYGCTPSEFRTQHRA